MPAKKSVRPQLDLRELRIGVGRNFKPLSQTYVARKCSVTPSVISKLEAGKLALSADMAWKLAPILKVHPDDVRTAFAETLRRVAHSD